MTEEKIEVSKEVLAPAEGPRQELISTAVKFLQNPKVQQSPLSQRRAFLEKKGLTKEEIDIAVERSGVPLDQPTQVYPPQPPGLPRTTGPLVSYQQLATPVSPYTKVKDVLHMVALIGGLSYAAYKFFKEILQPWILGKPRTDERLDKIENMVIDLQKNIVETLVKIQESLTTMQETMSANQEKVQAISHEVYSQRSNSAMTSMGDSQFATEMKSELQTLKGLLLNRRQFPPTPSSSSLPSWQLQNVEQTSTPAGTTKSLVKPSSDATSEEKDSNTIERKQDGEEETKVTFSDTSLEESEFKGDNPPEVKVDKLLDNNSDGLIDNQNEENNVDFTVKDKSSDSELD